LERLGPAGRRQNLETEFAQRRPDHLDVGFLVIHDQQAAGVGFW
jgi:hypothetical protein